MGGIVGAELYGKKTYSFDVWNPPKLNLLWVFENNNKQSLVCHEEEFEKYLTGKLAFMKNIFKMLS